MGKYDFELDIDTANTQSIIAGWVKDNSKILELGPANGRLTKYLSQIKKCVVDIVEIDEESGKQASKYANNSFLGTENGDIQKYYWIGEDRYDYVIIADVLEHLSRPDELLRRCREVLKFDGRILISVPNLSHGSVLIDLINDRFNYQSTGLLDNTHIHFFTYSSLLEMIDNSGMMLNEIVPIYSRVGDNEIQCSYDDVNGDLEREIRQLPHSAVYQYVCNIGNEKGDADEGLHDVEPFEQERYKPLELLLYYKSNGEEYSDQKVCRRHYSASGITSFSIELPNDIDINRVRINPMSANGVICLCEVLCATNEEINSLKMIATSAKYNVGNIYYFDRNYPNMEFALPDEGNIAGVINFELKVLDYRLSTFRQEGIESIFSAFAGGENSVSNGMLYQLEEQSDYIKHLEKDINILKEDISYLENNSQERKRYIEHLESDIDELQKTIVELSNESVIKRIIRKVKNSFSKE